MIVKSTSLAVYDDVHLGFGFYKTPRTFERQVARNFGCLLSLDLVLEAAACYTVGEERTFAKPTN